MLKYLTFLASLALAPAAHAGDFLEDFPFYVLKMIPANIAYGETLDTTTPEFRGTLLLLRDEWSAICGADVSVWHTSLIGGVDGDEWPANQWVVFFDDDYGAAKLPESVCLEDGYEKLGNMVIPGPYYHCLFREDDPEHFDQTCY
ncbi:MAG: hypothetical protein V3V13_12840 [Paracoccaceae bacterium]